MAQKLSATVEIGATLSGEFGRAFADADSRLRQFGSTLGVFRQADDDIHRYIRAQGELKTAQKANTEAMREYARLMGEKKKSWTDEQIANNGKALEAQKLRVDKARMALDRQQTSVRTLGATLKKGGIDTNNLSGAMEKLAENSAKVKERMRILGSLRGLNLGPIASRVLPSLMMRFPAFGKAFEKFAPSLADALPLLGSLATVAAGIGAAVTAAIYGVFRLGKGFSDWVDDLSDASDGLGTTIRDLAYLRVAASDAGIEAEKFDGQLYKMQQSLQAAKDGSMEQARAFRLLGLDVVTLQAKNTEEAFNDIADAFKNYSGNVSKASIANDIFGKGSSRLSGLLSKGKEGLQEYKRIAEDTNLLPSDEDIARAQEFDKAWNRFKNTLLGIRNTLGNFVLPALTEWLDKFTGGGVAQDLKKSDVGLSGMKMRWSKKNESGLITLYNPNDTKNPAGDIQKNKDNSGSQSSNLFSMWGQPATQSTATPQNPSYIPPKVATQPAERPALPMFEAPRLVPPAAQTASQAPQTTTNNRTVNITVNAPAGISADELSASIRKQLEQYDREEGLLYDGR